MRRRSEIECKIKYVTINRHTGKVGAGTLYRKWGTLDLVSGTRDSGPIMRDPGPGTLDEKYVLQTKIFFNSDPRTYVENIFILKAFIDDFRLQGSLKPKLASEQRDTRFLKCSPS